MSVWAIIIFRFLHCYSRNTGDSSQSVRIHHAARRWDSFWPWKHFHQPRLTVGTPGESFKHAFSDIIPHSTSCLPVRTYWTSWLRTRVHSERVSSPQGHVTGQPYRAQSGWERSPFHTISMKSRAGSCRRRSCIEPWSRQRESVNPWLCTSPILEIPQV